MGGPRKVQHDHQSCPEHYGRSPSTYLDYGALAGKQRAVAHLCSCTQEGVTCLEEDQSCQLHYQLCRVERAVFRLMEACPRAWASDWRRSSDSCLLMGLGFLVAEREGSVHPLAVVETAGLSSPEAAIDQNLEASEFPLGVDYGLEGLSQVPRH